jgi:hypothetical protein
VKPDWRLEVRLVRVRNAARLIKGQAIEQSHTLLDLRLSSLARWDTRIELPALDRVTVKQTRKARP